MAFEISHRKRGKTTPKRVSKGHRLPSSFGLSGAFPIFHAQYDWTTGVPDNGSERRKVRAIPRLYPLRSLVLCFM